MKVPSFVIKEHDRPESNALTTYNWSTVSGVVTHHDFLDQGPL